MQITLKSQYRFEKNVVVFKRTSFFKTKLTKFGPIDKRVNIKSNGLVDFFMLKTKFLSLS